MGYDLIQRPRWNYGKECRNLLCSFVPEREEPNFYDKTSKELGYVTTLEL